MLKAYPSVIHTSLISADTRGYHAQLSMVASYIDMISVIFIRGKSLELHAPMSIHTMSVSLGSYCIFSHQKTDTTKPSKQHTPVRPWLFCQCHHTATTCLSNAIWILPATPFILPQFHAMACTWFSATCQLTSLWSPSTNPTVPQISAWLPYCDCLPDCDEEDLSALTDKFHAQGY